MEVATSIGKSLVASPASAGGGGAAPGIGADFFEDFDYAAALSGGLNVVSAGMAFEAGKLDAASIKASAAWSELQADQETLNAEEKAHLIRDNLLEVLSAQSVAYTTSGIDVSIGAPLTVAARSVGEGAQAVTDIKRTGRIRALSHRQQARQLMLDAEASKYGGKVKAVGKAAAYVQRGYERGDFTFGDDEE